MPRTKSSDTNKDVKKDVTASSKKPVTKKREPVRLLRGMKDTLPEQQPYRQAVLRKLEEIATAYSYNRIDTPIVEQADLFIRSLGADTDVVDKEMYVFNDKSEDRVTLRPEFTAAIARAYIEHGMLNRPQPVKLYTTGPLFRYDRPQAGRYRQFHQIDFEIMGGKTPIIDAELIVVAHSLLKDLGVNTVVHINSLGSPEDRQTYIAELVTYLKSQRRKLSELSKKRLAKNPLRILDSKDEQDQEVIAEAPQIIDWLSEDSKEYFITVLEYLDDNNIPYELKSNLVRGLDYYNDVVFELYEEGEVVGSQAALAGGGRYDHLIESLGGPDATGACGFAVGIERIILAMKSLNVTVPGQHIPDIFLAQLGKSAQKYSLGLMEELRQAGFHVRANLVKGSLSAQLKMANRINARFTLILGKKELLDGTIILRDMESGSQEMVDIKKIEKELEKRLDRTLEKPARVMVGPQDKILDEEPPEEENNQRTAGSNGHNSNNQLNTKNTNSNQSGSDSTEQKSATEGKDAGNEKSPSDDKKKSTKAKEAKK